jgi:hypothetical protein
MLTNKIIKEMKRKLAKELYAFRAGRATAYLIFGIRQLLEKSLEIWKRVSDGILRL